MSKTEDLLHKLKAFKYLDATHLAIMAKLVTIKNFEEGEQLTEEGRFTFIGFILSGGVTYSVKDDDGKEMQIMDSFVRYPVGVLEAFNPRHHGSQMVRCNKACKILCLSFSDMDQLKIKHARLMMLFYQGIGELMTEVMIRLVFKFADK